MSSGSLDDKGFSFEFNDQGKVMWFSVQYKEEFDKLSVIIRSYDSNSRQVKEGQPTSINNTIHFSLDPSYVAILYNTKFWLQVYQVLCNIEDFRFEKGLIKEKRPKMLIETDKKEIATGWECPRCGSVNAPQKDKCKCIKTEGTTEDKRQLLQE